MLIFGMFIRDAVNLKAGHTITKKNYRVYSSSSCLQLFKQVGQDSYLL